MSLVAMTLLPFIIYLFITIIVIRYFYKKAKQLELVKRPTKIIILSYIVLLILSLSIYPAIKSTEFSHLTNAEVQQRINTNKTFVKNALANKLTAEDEKFLVDQWTYTIEGEQLDLELASPDEYIREQVIVHWTDAKNQQIEGKVYAINSVLLNLDLTAKVKSTLIRWTDNHTLNFKKPESVEIKGNLFTDEIGMFPFINSAMEISDADEILERDNSIYVVLKVPKHINVNDVSGLRLYPQAED
ncbi:hypothetical protein ACQKMD_17360 [Viridibacillus sp. NPDC096237]|uniref:hypothetical protein n=1 Tax=Viridibacillus sp. NPDC096237 TaxID=3390721 RepID=UPI003D00E4F6